MIVQAIVVMSAQSREKRTGRCPAELTVAQVEAEGNLQRWRLVWLSDK